MTTTDTPTDSTADQAKLYTKLAEVMGAVGYVQKTGCWEWPRAISANGYGTFKFKGTNYYAHRVSYERARGPIPSGMWIDHLCRNRKCVNPAHLEPVEPAENCRRGAASKLTMADARAIRASDAPTSELARTFGVAVPTICNIRAGRRWKEKAND